MSKFYLITFLCLISASFTYAQTFTWIGPAGGAWSDAANWSNGAVPNGVGHDVIFNTNAVVDVDLDDITLNTLTVTSNAKAQLVAISTVNLTLNSGSTASPALLIDAGSTLVDSTDADVDFIVFFADNAQARIDGTWRFGTSVEHTNANGPIYLLPETTGLSNLVAVNGTIEHGFNTGVIGFDFTEDEYIAFNDGSVFQLEVNGGTIPNVLWHANSTIRLLGNTTISPSLTEKTEIGNLVYSSPNQFPVELTLDLRNIIVRGNLEVTSTNSSDLVIVGNGTDQDAETISLVIEGDLNISGDSRVFIADASYNLKDYVVEVGGSINAGGELFDLQRDSELQVDENPTLLRVGGDINHTAGVFTTSSPATSSTADLFVIELNGTAPQLITSVTGTFDNSSNQVTLRMNNAAGVTLMSPLAVGQLSFASAAGGAITASAANYLTINDTSLDAVTYNATPNLGYVDGPVRRRTAGTGAYSFPTGEGGVLRAVTLTPSAVAANTYQAEYVGTAYSDLSVVAPLSGVTNLEYWQIAQPAGTTSATVTLTLNGAVPGASAADAILVGKYNGADWTNARGATGTIVTPGTATTGSVRSELQTTFGDYTLAYAAQGALPITLVDFNARKLSSTSADVKWDVTATSTPSHFEVLKSVNGRDFSVLGVVGGVNGKERYNYVDTELAVGTTYYRLRMVDIDGSVSYSKVVAVLNGGSEVLITSMMPTVVTGRAKLNVSSSKRGTLQLSITDMHGRMIQQKQAAIAEGSQDIWLDLQSLASGTYQVTGYFDGKRVSSIRFVKQ